jgi:hypothetical protein
MENKPEIACSSVQEYETLLNANSKPTDVPHIFYVNGYQDGIKEASELLVKMSKDAYSDYDDPRVVLALTRAGMRLREWIKVK